MGLNWTEQECAQEKWDNSLVMVVWEMDWVISSSGNWDGERKWSYYWVGVSSIVVHKSGMTEKCNPSKKWKEYTSESYSGSDWLLFPWKKYKQIDWLISWSGNWEGERKWSYNWVGTDFCLLRNLAWTRSTIHLRDGKNTWMSRILASTDCCCLGKKYK